MLAGMLHACCGCCGHGRARGEGTELLDSAGAAAGAAADSPEPLRLPRRASSPPPPLPLPLGGRSDHWQHEGPPRPRLDRDLREDPKLIFGVSHVGWHASCYSDRASRDAIGEIRALGANLVSLTSTYYLDSGSSCEVRSRGVEGKPRFPPPFFFIRTRAAECHGGGEIRALGANLVALTATYYLDSGSSCEASRAEGTLVCAEHTYMSIFPLPRCSRGAPRPFFFEVGRDWSASAAWVFIGPRPRSR